MKAEFSHFPAGITTSFAATELSVLDRCRLLTAIIHSLGLDDELPPEAIADIDKALNAKITEDKQ